MSTPSCAQLGEHQDWNTWSSFACRWRRAACLRKQRIERWLCAVQEPTSTRSARSPAMCPFGGASYQVRLLSVRPGSQRQALLRTAAYCATVKPSCRQLCLGSSPYFSLVRRHCEVSEDDADHHCAAKLCALHQEIRQVRPLDACKASSPPSSASSLLEAVPTCAAAVGSTNKSSMPEVAAGL